MTLFMQPYKGFICFENIINPCILHKLLDDCCRLFKHVAQAFRLFKLGCEFFNSFREHALIELLFLLYISFRRLDTFPCICSVI